MFASTQDAFASALLDAARPIPAALTSHTTREPVKRFAVYRNNVVVGLIDALADRFPVTSRLVGEEFFRAMARIYVTAHPPQSPLLMVYGDGFPDFIAGFAPAAEVIYLADVARLEAARTRAYHAADAETVDPRELAALDQHMLGGLRILPHPSAQIVRSPHPIVTIWAMNSGELALGPIEDWRGEDALVVRPRLDVEVRSLPRGGAAFLAALLAGEALAAAIEAAQRESADFDLVVNLAGLMTAGVATAVSVPAMRRE
jgi:Putative DNA-binding domain